jgi:hypothetical protein
MCADYIWNYKNPWSKFGVAEHWDTTIVILMWGQHQKLKCPSTAISLSFILHFQGH